MVKLPKKFIVAVASATFAYPLGVAAQDSEGEQEAVFGSTGLCVIGCTPSIDPFNEDNGIREYRAVMEEMAQTWDVLVNLGDAKPGSIPCNKNVLTNAVHILSEAAAPYGKLALYGLGDNEM